VGPYLLPDLIPALHELAPQMPLDIEENLTENLDVALRTGQDDNMLVASVLMEGHLSFGSIPEQSGGRPRDSISVEAMDLHTVAKGLPRNGVGVLGNSKEIVQFYARIARSRIRFHSARKSNPRVPEMARLLSQIAAVSKEGVGWKI
jgi:hypothetical protein